MQIVLAFSSWLISRSQKQTYAVCSVLGVLLTLALPPFHLLPLIFPAFGGLIALLYQAPTTREAFFRGWWFGLGHFVTGLYWILIALSLDGLKYAWLMPIALFALPAYLGLFTGLAGWVYRKFLLPEWRGVLVFAMAWVGCEYLRALLMSGFPWNLSGYVWTLHPLFMQPASLVGAFGMSLWTIILSTSFVASLLTRRKKKKAKRDMRFRTFGVCALVFTLLLGWSGWRLHQAPALNAQNDDRVMLRIVQPSIDQGTKWDPEHQWANLQTLAYLSRKEGFEKLDYVIWPETAMPFPFEDGSRWAHYLAENAVPPSGVLLTGVMDRDDDGKNLRIWNSVKALGPDADVIDEYHKSKLVPGGEFLPLRGLFDILKLSKVTHGSIDFSRGEGADTLVLEGVRGGKFQPLICYEAIFPFYRPMNIEDRPLWLLNITNDGWFGVSSGPYQHLRMSQMRAVEQGVPLVRAANSGVSALFDAYGREVASLPLNERGVLDVSLPNTTPPTFYGTYGSVVVIMLCYLLLMVAFHRQVAK